MAKDLKSIVDRVVDLPTLPQVVTKIMSLIEDPNSSAKQINDVMSNDPALVAKILKLVNSAFYALPNRVTSIQQAITILGFNTIKSLAISASVFDLFGAGAGGFSYEKFWAHSICTATASSAYAKETKRDADIAFVIGLLHGMGKLVLDQYSPMEFQDIINGALRNSITFEAAEEIVLETSHADIGFWLSNKWKLAEVVQNSVQYQANVESCPEDSKEFVAILQLARYACSTKGIETPGDFNQPTPPAAAMAALNITEEDLPEILEKIGAELERAEGFLAVIQN